MFDGSRFNTADYTRMCIPCHRLFDAEIHSGSSRGSRNGMSRLTEDQVRKVFLLKEPGVYNREIAAELGVSRQTVDRILAGETWKHVFIETPERAMDSQAR